MSVTIDPSGGKIQKVNSYSGLPEVSDGTVVVCSMKTSLGCDNQMLYCGEIW